MLAAGTSSEVGDAAKHRAADTRSEHPLTPLFDETVTTANQSMHRPKIDGLEVPI